MNSPSCSSVDFRNTGAVSRMKSFQNWPGSSPCWGAGPSRISASSKPCASSVPANDSSITNTTRCPRRRSTSPIPTQLFVGPYAPSGKKTIVDMRSFRLQAGDGGRAARLAAAENEVREHDGGERQRQDHHSSRIDDRGDAEPKRREDPQRQRRRARPGDEERRDEVVERERERQQPACDDRRAEGR